MWVTAWAVHTFVKDGWLTGLTISFTPSIRRRHFFIFGDSRPVIVFDTNTENAQFLVNDLGDLAAFADIPIGIGRGLFEVGHLLGQWACQSDHQQRNGKEYDDLYPDGDVTETQQQGDQTAYGCPNGN